MNIIKTIVMILLIILIHNSCTKENGTLEGVEKEVQSNRSQSEVLFETWLKTVTDFENITGCAIAVIHDSETVYSKGFGLIDLDNGKAVTSETIFRIASLTKIFTATAIFILRDRHKLKLEDTVSDHLSWFKPELSLADNLCQPTIADLLCHIGGLPCEPDYLFWDNPQDLFPKREEFINRLKKIKLIYKPKEVFNYSNLGYALLGEIISECSGETYDQFITKNILKPLNMMHTYIDYVPSDERTASGYSKIDRSHRQRIKLKNLDANAMAPAIGIYTNPDDLAKFIKWQFRILGKMDSSVLQKNSLQEMYSAQWENPQWGYGYAIWKLGDKKIVGHYGSAPGYKAELILSPDEKIAVIVLCNVHDAPQHTIAFEAYKTIGQSCLTETKKTKAGSKWEKYMGYYSSDLSWANVEVVEWNGNLNIMWLPAYSSINSLIKLKKIHNDEFREIRHDTILGKHYFFKFNSDSEATALKFNNNILIKNK